MNYSNLSGCNLIGLASSIAILISENATVSEMTILSGFFSSIGDNLAVLASTKPSHTKKKKNNKLYFSSSF